MPTQAEDGAAHLGCVRCATVADSEPGEAHLLPSASSAARLAQLNGWSRIIQEFKKHSAFKKQSGYAAHLDYHSASFSVLNYAFRSAAGILNCGERG